MRFKHAHIPAWSLRRGALSDVPMLSWANPGPVRSCALGHRCMRRCETGASHHGDTLRIVPLTCINVCISALSRLSDAPKMCSYSQENVELFGMAPRSRRSAKCLLRHQWQHGHSEIDKRFRLASGGACRV